MRILTSFFLFTITSASPLAHTGHADAERTAGWSFEWWIVLGLAIPSLLYAVGLARMQRRLGLWRVIKPAQLAAFVAGMLTLFAALISPIDTLADQLFSAHMVQHLLLLFVAPPLLVLSRPAVVLMWAFRSSGRRSIGRFWTSFRLNRLVHHLMHPFVIWILFSGLFVFWHFPKPYGWALANEGVHSIEHLCFFISALMFWTIVIEPSGRRRLSYPATLLHVATSAVVSSLPGALILLAPHPLYPLHSEGAAAWGLTPLQDQQLAGVIMWVPGGLAYLAAVSWLFLRWLQEDERAQRPRLRPLGPKIVTALAIGVVLSAISSQYAAAQSLTPGRNAEHGRVLIRQFGCGACHTIPGIAGADAEVGPPLTGIGRRIYIAGVLRNTPDNLATWIEHPQHVVPGNAMPDMGISRQQAEDIAAYLMSLR